MEEGASEMTILACSGFDEGPGANFTPPTLGEFMKKREAETRILREARAGAIVTREARLFHERQARKHGINTSRGLAHFRASKMFTREASKLQEMFEQGGHLDELPPKAVIKANKAAMMFHKKQAEKNGLDSDVGHAHVAAMEHHADIIKKAKAQGQQQQPQMEADEGGPGSGPRKGSGRARQAIKDDIRRDRDKEKERKEDMNARRNIADMQSRQKAHQDWIKGHPEREALPGYGGKQSPVPVPRKADMPNQDQKDPNKPPVNLNPADANKQPRKLQQTAGAHAGLIRAGGPGSGPRPKGLEKKSYGYRQAVKDAKTALDNLNSKRDKFPNDHPAVKMAQKQYNNRISDVRAALKSHRKHSNEAREAERLDMGTGCDYPKGVGRQVEPYLVTRQPRTKEAAEGGPGSGPQSGKAQKRFDKAYRDGIKSGYSHEKSLRLANRAFDEKPRKMVTPFDDITIHKGQHYKSKESRRPILESRRNEDDFDDGTPRPIDLKSIYQKPERTQGWKNSNVYSPAIPKFEKESRAIIREY
jgi:hypothetical protein